MYLSRSVSRACRLTAFASVIAIASLPAAATPQSAHAPLQFFQGRTELVSVVKVVMRKPFRSRTIGQGQILPDGSLSLVQNVQDEARPPQTRSWRIRQIAHGRFGGTMSDAVGPVQVDEVGGKYRFRFRMKGNLAVEQWLIPMSGGNSAKSRTIVRKMGIKVATADGVIRRI